MKTTIAVALLVGFALTSSAAEQTKIDYRFDEVKRRVVLTTPKQELQVTRGHHAESGDKVETGWFSYALIASDQFRMRFEIFSSTNVRLADGTPGVVLSLDRGRLRAMFDKITGSEPRVVQTPGALLAIRGTKFDVAVDTDGRTTLDVFEGTVEVRSLLRAEPMFVHAGQESIFGRQQTPDSHPMPEDRRRNGPGRPGDNSAPRDPRTNHQSPKPPDDHH